MAKIQALAGGKLADFPGAPDVYVLDNGKRVAIGPAYKMICRARRYIGATVVTLDGKTIDTCQAYEPPHDTYRVRVPALMSLETVHCREWN